MADNKAAANDNESDPIAAFRSVRDTYLEPGPRPMVDAVNSEAYARTNGVILGTCLTASAPFREATEKAMLQAIQQLSMPSRGGLRGSSGAAR